MFLEVTVGNSRPVTFRLSRPQVAVGSLPSNDIVVSGQSISKRHLKIYLRDDRWFLMDQGSTNGSYLDHEALIGGIEVELPVRAEVQLGGEVFLRLLDQVANDEVRELPEPVELDADHPQEKTRKFSLEEFKARQAK